MNRIVSLTFRLNHSFHETLSEGKRQCPLLATAEREIRASRLRRSTVFNNVLLCDKRISHSLQ